MKKLFRRDEGAAAVEFSLIAPIFLVLAIGSLDAGIAFWKWNAIQGIAKTTARCVAIGSNACSAVTAGCSSSDAGICFALTQASTSGVSELAASNITVQRSVSVAGTLFTKVAISLDTTMLAIPITLSIEASYPNN